MSANDENGRAIELKVDRSLINNNFDNYLLSRSRHLEMRKTELPTLALARSPSGYQHVKAFNEADRLVIDLFVVDAAENHLYTILETGAIVKAIFKLNVRL